MFSFTLGQSLKQSRFAVLTSLAVLAWSNPASAAIHVFSPIIEEGEVEFETKFDRTVDKSAEKDDQYSYNFSLGYAPTDYYAFELETQNKHDPGGKNNFDLFSFENRFQLTEQGKYFADFGFFFEYEHVALSNDNDNITFGPIIQKEFGRNLTTINLFFNKTLGTHAQGGLQVDYRIQNVYTITEAFKPGVEIYGEPGKFGSFSKIDDSRLRGGPVVIGAVSLGRLGKLKYETGYLFGATRASESGTFRSLLELEFHL